MKDNLTVCVCIARPTADALRSCAAAEQRSISFVANRILSEKLLSVNQSEVVKND